MDVLDAMARYLAELPRPPRGLMDNRHFFAFMQTDTFARMSLATPVPFRNWLIAWLQAGGPSPRQQPSLWRKRPLLPSERTRPFCAARTRKGTPCRNRLVYRGNRCKYHGGFSTGPRRTGHTRRYGRYHSPRLRTS